MSTSPSGARIQGDDYQHLYAWYRSLHLLMPEESVTHVEVESHDAGNVDDVVVRRANGTADYIQVKYSVDASKPVSSKWLTTSTTATGKSPLQRFAMSWQQLKAKEKWPRLMLVTNRVLDPEDPILKLRDGLNATVGQRLSEATARSAAGKQLAAWAKHTGLTKDDLLELLFCLCFKTDHGAWSGLVEATADRMRAVGLNASDVDVEAGVTAIRSAVKNGIRSLDRGALQVEVERRKLTGDKRYSTLLVEAIDHAPWPDAAQVRLDWVNQFVGDEPRARRQLRDPAGWSSKLRPEMVNAAKALTAIGNKRILVRGYMRLPLWFLCGVELPDTRGHHVSCFQKEQWWSSEAAPTSFALSENTTPLGLGNEIAVGLSVTTSIGPDVMAYCRKAALPVLQYVDLAPEGGAGPQAIGDGTAALGWAVAVRSAVRNAVRPFAGARIHLFMSGPAGGALLLGHVWNRVGPTVVYEDLSPGYAPTFEIPS